MLPFLTEYGLFLAKALTIVVAILIVIGGIAAILTKGKGKHKGKIEVKKINDRYDEMKETLHEVVLAKSELKKAEKESKKAKKSREAKIKKGLAPPRKKVYVLHFNGDIRASAVSSLREIVTAILTVATPSDEVVACIDSPGGIVPNYGLAASQLKRIRAREIPLTAIIDRVAASGGYMMACVANRILAAPFAIVGSIGVVGQLPNFNRFLKKHNIDFEQITAGEYKRTLSLFGENTPKGRQKFQEEVEDAQALFKAFVSANRPIVDIDKVATGEHWHGAQALDYKLVDSLMTSDDYLLNLSQTANLYEVTYATKPSALKRLTSSMQSMQTYFGFL